MLKNVIWVGTNDLKMVVGTYRMRTLSYGLDKGAIFAKICHFGHGSGEIGLLVERKTLMSYTVSAYNHIQVISTNPNNIFEHFGLVISTENNLVLKKHVFSGILLEI